MAVEDYSATLQRRHFGTWMKETKIAYKLCNSIKSPGDNMDIYSTISFFLKAYILGSATSINRVLSDHPPMTSRFWLAAHILNAILRTAGAPIFLNNPISGALIFVAISMTNNGAGSVIAATALLGTVISAVTAIWLFNEKEEKLSSGSAIFNGFLTGLLLTDYNGLKDRPWLLVPIIVASFMR